jgi:hypothetical protein
MSIIQISKIQQRSGNIVDLPQLDEAEFGWASDTRQLFIGKTTPNENIEVLTSYSQINFDQINGTVGNLNISNATVANGQLLVYDNTDWVNRGGSAGGLINLGEVSNVKISGGAIGYVLETDGLGNLSWTPKSSIISFIQNVTKANPAVVTTTQDNFLTDKLQITITGAQGMTQLNGNTYYVDVLTSNTFALYSDVGLATPVNTTGGGFTAYSSTSAASTIASTNVVTVGDSSVFSLNQEVEFVGNLGNSSLENNTPYYIKTIPGGGTTITVSTTPGGTVKSLNPATLVGASVYATGGRTIATVSGGSATSAQGSEGSVQYYASGLLQGDAGLVWNTSVSPNTLTVTGNINTGNVSATGVITAPQLISNIATGTAPLAVTSTTRVANLSVNYANVSDFSVVTNQTTGTFFPVFVDSSSTGNRALGANANVSFNAATGALISTLYTGTLTTAAQPNVTSLGTLTGLGVNGTITGVNITANTGVFTGNASGLSEINASNLSSGTVPTARLSGTYAISISGNANVANTANAVAGGNVSGQVGNALVAGTVYTNAQPNITSVGTLTALAVSGNVNLTGANVSLGSNGNVRITGGSSGQLMATDGTGNLSWVNQGSIISGAAGTNTQVQYNALGLLAASSNFTFNYLTNVLNINGNIASNGTIGGASADLFGNVLTTGANTTAGSITGNWTLTAGSRMEATYADLAEYYEADEPYEPGTVLMFGGEKEVTLAEDGTSRVAGVVSTNPAYVMNSTCPGLLTAVALQGRVPCKVRGKISKGDMLISGGNGFARPNQFPAMGTVIGKALEDFDGYEGIIEVAVGRL